MRKRARECVFRPMCVYFVSRRPTQLTASTSCREQLTDSVIGLGYWQFDITILCHMLQ